MDGPSKNNGKHVWLQKKGQKVKEQFINNNDVVTEIIRELTTI